MLREKSWKLKHKIFGDSSRLCGVACIEDWQGCEQDARSPAILSISEVTYCAKTEIRSAVSALL